MIRSDNLKFIFIGLIMLATQVILLRHLQIYNAEADLILIFLLWLCSRKSRTESIIFAAVFGLSQDAMTDLWGLNMFSKTLLIFFFHNYLNKLSENRLILWQIFLILLLAAFLHNLIFILLSNFTDLYSTAIVAWSMLIGGSLYTAIVGSFLHLVRNE
ncbi:MAG: rod shape-determining protein MreD [Balneolaceae bacterium]